MGQQMLDRNYVKQPQQRDHIQNNIKESMQKIVLGWKTICTK